MILAGKVLALVDGRSHLSCDDIRSMLLPSLRHRMILNFEGEAEDIKSDQILNEVLATVSDMQ